jgi:hypothetical protein
MPIHEFRKKPLRVIPRSTPRQPAPTHPVHRVCAEIECCTLTTGTRCERHGGGA